MAFETVKEVIIDTLKFKGDVTPESDLFKDLGADSLDAVELVMALEEKTGVLIPDEEVGNLHTVSDIVSYIESHQD